MANWGRIAAGVATGGMSEVARGAAKAGGDLLFGKGPSVDSINNLTPEQQALLNSIISTMSPTIGSGVKSFSGSMYAPTGGINTALFSKINDLLTNGGPNSDAVKGIIDKYAATGIETFNPNEVNDLFTKTVKEPALKNFKEDILPEIAERYAGRNAFQSGGTYHEMVTAGKDLETDLSNQLTTMLQTEKGAVAGRNATNVQALSSLLGIDEQTLNMILTHAGSAGTTEQGLNQQPFTEAFTKWSTEQPYNNPWFNILGNVLNQTTTPVVNPGQEGLIQMLLPALTQAGTALMMA